MGLFSFRSKNPRESDVFQNAFEEAFRSTNLPFLKRAKLLAVLYEAFKAGVADLGAKEAVEISGLSNEKLKPLLDRTWRLTHSKLQRQRIEGAAEALPYLMLDVTPGTSVRPQCIEMDGIARRVDDPYWRENYPPCDRIDCMCRVIQLSDRQVQREGITVLPPEVGKPDANP